jgi:hypothetical protein
LRILASLRLARSAAHSNALSYSERWRSTILGLLFRLLEVSLNLFLEKLENPPLAIAHPIPPIRDADQSLADHPFRLGQGHPVETEAPNDLRTEPVEESGEVLVRRTV